MDNHNQEIIVPQGQSPERLDVFVTQHTSLSRSQIQKQIKAGTIMLNGKKTKPNHEVQPGGVISFGQDIEIQEKKVAPEQGPEVIFEDDQYLVVNKPSGLVVHGGPGIHE